APDIRSTCFARWQNARASPHGNRGSRLRSHSRLSTGSCTCADNASDNPAGQGNSPHQYPARSTEGDAGEDVQNSATRYSDNDSTYSATGGRNNRTRGCAKG